MAVLRRALVVGAGIGGLTAGVALARQGIAVDIVEVQPALSVYGVGIIQPNNTLRALARIGLADACVEAGAPYPGWRIFDAHGNHLMDAPGTNDADPRYPANNGITRPKLHEILRSAAIDAGVVIRLGLTIEDLTDGDDGVAVIFTDGSAGLYDIVIGCDGLHSKMRGRIFPDAAEPAFTGQGVWRYNMPRPADMEWGVLYFGPDSKVGLVPMSDTLMYMLIVTHEPGNPRIDGPGLADMMRDRLEAYTGPVAELGRLITDPAGVVYRPMDVHLLANPWHKGRVLLIGDAAHGTTPHLAQGAAMAIEDAVLLGELLGGNRPLPHVFDEFMRRRFDRAKFVIDSSVQIGKWEMEEWDGVAGPDANPGGLLHSATLALMDDY